MTNKKFLGGWATLEALLRSLHRIPCVSMDELVEGRYPMEIDRDVREKWRKDEGAVLASFLVTHAEQMR